MPWLCKYSVKDGYLSCSHFLNNAVDLNMKVFFFSILDNFLILEFQKCSSSKHRIHIFILLSMVFKLLYNLPGMYKRTFHYTLLGAKNVEHFDHVFNNYCN